jgi:hypothetical protein
MGERTPRRERKRGCLQVHSTYDPAVPRIAFVRIEKPTESAGESSEPASARAACFYQEREDVGVGCSKVSAESLF